MYGIASRLRDERGVGVVAALLVVLILALLGTVMVGLTVQEMDAGRRHVQGEQALMAAEAGLQYAQKQFAADSDWTGLPEPGRAVGRGHFIVVVNTTDADGTTVASPTKVLHAIGLVGDARRDIVVRATPASGSGSTSTLVARAPGNALSFPAPQGFTNAGRMVDANSANLTYATGEWQHQQQVVVGGWAGGAVTGSVTRVELWLYGFVSGTLVNDYATAEFYLNNTPSGSAVTISTTTLNTRRTILAILLGPWKLDLTAARAWSASDFSGDLELLWSNEKTASDDGPTINLDAAILKVTTAGSSTTFDTFREVIS